MLSHCCQAGDEIVGTLTCAPNQRNNRDLDITISYESKGERPTSDHLVYKMCVFWSYLIALSFQRGTTADVCLGLD